jgi:hypothetical protein
MTDKKNIFSQILRSENGSVIVPSLMVLMLVTIIGTMAIRTSSSDIGITTNYHLYERTFYAAEAARAYVRNNPNLYGSSHITTGILVAFPDDANPATTRPVDPGSGEPEAYRGTVEYLSSTTPPRGSGFQVTKFKAHNYRMICEGHGPRNTINRIESGFYRIGF